MPTTLRQRSCLVTGGAGFVGSHLVERLLARGDRVFVADDLSTGSLANLEQLPEERLTIIQARVSDVLPERTPGEFDEIYHLAAAVGVRLVIEQPVHTIETNILETSAILEFAAASGGTPILITSTSEVYGKSNKTPFREDDDVVYGPTIFSRWSYGCSKAIDEYLALAYRRQSRLPVVIARLFNTIGPRQIGHYGMVVPRFVAAAIAGAPIEVYGDGRQTRCFCDVRDVVELLPRLLAEPRCAGEVVNVGRDEPIEILALAERVRGVLGSASCIDLIPYDQAFGEGFDDLRHRRPDLTKLRSLVDFTPRHDLDRTITDLAEHLRSLPPEVVEAMR
jgi:UDP-glucose 4-epimerase